MELTGEGKPPCHLLNRIQNVQGGVNDFRSDPVAGHNHDSVGFELVHVSVLEKQVVALHPTPCGTESPGPLFQRGRDGGDLLLLLYQRGLRGSWNSVSTRNGVQAPGPCLPSGAGPSAPARLPGKCIRLRGTLSRRRRRWRRRDARCAGGPFHGRFPVEDR